MLQSQIHHLLSILAAVANSLSKPVWPLQANSLRSHAEELETLEVILARGLYRDSQQIETPVGMLRIGLEVAKSFKDSKTGKDKLYQGHLARTLNLVVYKDGGEEELDQSDARKAVQLFYDYYVKRQRAPLAPKNDDAVGSAINGKRSSTGRGAGRA